MLYAIQLHRFIHNFEEKLKCFYYLLMLLVFTFQRNTQSFQNGPFDSTTIKNYS